MLAQASLQRITAEGCSAAIQGVDGGGMRIGFAALCLAAGFLLARPKATGRLRYFFHLGTYALFVKLLYPFFSIESRICLQQDPFIQYSAMNTALAGQLPFPSSACAARVAAWTGAWMIP